MASKPEDDKGWLEPEYGGGNPEDTEESRPQYPYNRVIQTESGHVIELDDTPGRERIRVTHRVGSFIEMLPNGDVTHKTFGNDYRITTSNKNVLIEGYCNITVVGDVVMDVQGNKIERVSGDYKIECGGEFVAYSHTKASVLSDLDTQIAAGSGEISAGDVYITTGGKIYGTGDMIIAGGFTADMIVSKGRVDAANGVSAGPLGFVSVEGGLTIGGPVAFPGTISTIGMVNAGMSINSPFANLGVMKATWMTDTINKSLNNAHIHVGFKGPTGPPVPRGLV